MIETSAGKYLGIEGIDGGGKSTQVSLLGNRLRALGLSVVETAEPSGTPMGTGLKQLLIDNELERQHETEIDLYIAARREVFNQVVLPGVTRGDVVITDRFWPGMVAYQGYGWEMGEEAIKSMLERSKRIMGDLFIPAAAVILDVPPELGASRMLDRGNKRDWFEQQGEAFFKRVREGYLWVAEHFDMEVVDGSPAIEEVEKKVFEVLGTTATQALLA